MDTVPRPSVSLGRVFALPDVEGGAEWAERNDEQCNEEEAKARHDSWVWVSGGMDAWGIGAAGRRWIEAFTFISFPIPRFPLSQIHCAPKKMAAPSTATAPTRAKKPGLV